MSLALPKLRLPVSLRHLLPQSSFVGCADIHVSDATEKSGECEPNSLFAAIAGMNVDGNQFVEEAIGRGATSLLVKNPLAGVSIAQCVVPNVRIAYAQLCEALAGHPSRLMKVCGVTGTNGKTSVSWLIRSMLKSTGSRVGLLGTVEYSDGINVDPSGMTTPDAKTLAQWLAAMLLNRTSYAAVELSSHALDQGRCAGTMLDAAVVTNVTHDHFDYHGDYAAYLASKTRILRQLKKGAAAVLNADDPGSTSMKTQVPASCELITYGLQMPADVSAEITQESLRGSRFTLRFDGKQAEICTPLIGRHNVSNCLAAAASAAHCGASMDDIAAGIESLASVPGRLERVDCGQMFDVFVDYAHTDDALRQCIRFVSGMTRGRVICVFGAGGDRDRSKRPLLASAASEADCVVVTSDNPRSEDPHDIIVDIFKGFDPGRADVHVEVDRAEAIGWALEQAQPNDSVVIAGKGHETVQVIGRERIPFDDREVVRGVLERQTTHNIAHPVRMRA